MQSLCRLRLLGTVQIEQNGVLLRELTSRKALALLGYLVRQNQPVSRSHLADLFWGYQTETRGRRNLSRELSQLSRRLPNCFQADYYTVQFQPAAGYWVDTAAFDELIQRGARPPSASEDEEAHITRLTETAKLYRGEFMAGHYLDNCPDFESWLVREQEIWRQRIAEVLDKLINYHLLHRQESSALAFARRWLALEPWRERAHRHLMLVLVLSGQRSAALVQYETCRRVLAEELGVEPAPETTALCEQIRAGVRLQDLLLPGQEEKNRQRAITETSGHDDPLAASAPRQDWDEAPDLNVFYGRQAELAVLEQWLVADRCRLVIIQGMGGTGKTALAARVAGATTSRFDYVIWRSLINAPGLAGILRVWLEFLSDQQLTELPDNLDDQLALLFGYLRRQRCLLVLDNFEGIMQGGDRAGRYRPGCEDYGRLILRLGASKHQSCLLITSREKPREFVRLEEAGAPVRSYELGGLDAATGQHIMAGRGLTGPAEAMTDLVARYSGNPLALIVAAVTIRDLFGGDLQAFLTQETVVLDDIRDILDQQLDRLPALERDIVLRLAMERDAVSPMALWSYVASRNSVSRSRFLEALNSLRRRSLLERKGDGFTLPNLVTGYLTTWLQEVVPGDS